MDPRAGKPAERSMLANIPRLMTAYYTRKPDASRARAAGGLRHLGPPRLRRSTAPSTRTTSSPSRRRSATYRRQQGIDGPLFLGIDTHALSESAFASALEVLAANEVDVMIDDRGGYTPTPVISHAILTYNRGRTGGLADGIVITPSHNPPEDGGFKYNPPNGGPADTDVTGWIQDHANALLADGLRGVKRMPSRAGAPRATTHRHDYMSAYVDDLGARRRHGRHPWREARARRRSAGRRRRPLLGHDRASATGCRSPSSATWSIRPSAS